MELYFTIWFSKYLKEKCLSYFILFIYFAVWGTVFQDFQSADLLFFASSLHKLIRERIKELVVRLRKLTV